MVFRRRRRGKFCPKKVEVAEKDFLERRRCPRGNSWKAQFFLCRVPSREREVPNSKPGRPLYFYFCSHPSGLDFALGASYDSKSRSQASEGPRTGGPGGHHARPDAALRTRKQGTGGIPELKTGYQGQI